MKRKIQTASGRWSPLSTLLTGLFLLVWSVTGRADSLNYWNRQTSGTTSPLAGIVYTNGLFVAVGGAGTILTSSDGAIWTAQGSGTTNDLGGITYGAGLYLAVGSSDTVVSSADAVHWTVRTTGLGVEPRTADYNSVCFGQGQFVAVANNGQGVNHVVASTDGVHWTLEASTPSQPLPARSG